MFQSLFDLQARLDKISDNGDPLWAINEVVPWEMFRAEFEGFRAEGHEPKDMSRKARLDENRMAGRCCSRC